MRECLTLAKSEALLISETPPSPLNLKRGSTSPPKSSSPQKRRT